jgi:hypothetical protein
MIWIFLMKKSLENIVFIYKIVSECIGMGCRLGVIWWGILILWSSNPELSRNVFWINEIRILWFRGICWKYFSLSNFKFKSLKASIQCNDKKDSDSQLQNFHQISQIIQLKKQLENIEKII